MNKERNHLKPISNPVEVFKARKLVVFKAPVKKDNLSDGENIHFGPSSPTKDEQETSLSSVNYSDQVSNKIY